MFKRNKLWVSVGAATLSTSALVACQPNAVQHDTMVNPTPTTSIAAAPEGEGEGPAATVHLASNDLAYLTQLGLVRGHLYVGYQLYMTGHLAQAKTHMKHPESELYADLVPAFQLRGTDGFAEPLSQLANAVNQDLGQEQVSQAYHRLTHAIAHNEHAVSSHAQSTAATIQLAASLLRVAGEEYAIAVVDGKMENAHEYQDALGFTTIAEHLVQQLADSEAKHKATTLIDSIMPLWPTLVPPDTLDTDAGQIQGVAARLELLAASL